MWRVGLTGPPRSEESAHFLYQSCTNAARSSNLNAYAERSVPSSKSECLAHIIRLGERHLRHVVKEYTEHHHVERNHQGLDNRLIEEQQGVVDMNSAIVGREGEGEILNDYERRAAWTVG